MYLKKNNKNHSNHSKLQMFRPNFKILFLLVYELRMKKERKKWFEYHCMIQKISEIEKKKELRIRL